MVRSRLIPARAGKTRSAWRGDRWRRAHPRAGGENRSPLSCHVARSGSSPRGRGKHVLRSQRRRAPRLIPARAGKTVHPIRRCGRNRAHPRAGGENFASASTVLKKPGSSPRGRGKRRRLVVAGDHVGLIPARAGKTSSAPSWQASRPAHPRAGGENPQLGFGTSISEGSSPRGRGKLKGKNVEADVARLIPARAGKTQRREPNAAAPQAHPRAGGENA